MFSKRDVVARMKTLKLRVQENKEETKRVVDLKYELRPLTPELAADIDTRMARDLFMEQTRGGERSQVPRSEIREVDFILKIPRQNLSIKMTSEMPRSLDLMAVDVTSVKVTRGKDDVDFVLRFNVSLEKPGRDEWAELGDQLNDPVALTFQKMQKPLPLDGDVGEASAAAPA